MGVKLEILRMLLYLSFPVGIFWVSNQAERFQRLVVQRKREIFPPDNPQRRQALAELKRRLGPGRGQQEPGTPLAPPGGTESSPAGPGGH